jgi:hypothetical protein
MATKGDFVNTTQTAVTEKKVGTITIPHGGARIVALWSFLVENATITAAEVLAGTIRLSSADVALEPAKFPVGTLAQGITTSGNKAMHGATMIPVNIPVPSKADIDVYITLARAVSNAADIYVGVIWE